jgi:hypothetical protein
MGIPPGLAGGGSWRDTTVRVPRPAFLIAWIEPLDEDGCAVPGFSKPEKYSDANDFFMAKLLSK